MIMLCVNMILKVLFEIRHETYLTNEIHLHGAVLLSVKGHYNFFILAGHG
jgi:hypothetical protein